MAQVIPCHRSVFLYCLIKLMLCSKNGQSFTLPACLPACMPACMPACLPACLPACRQYIAPGNILSSFFSRRTPLSILSKAWWRNYLANRLFAIKKLYHILRSFQPDFLSNERSNVDYRSGFCNEKSYRLQNADGSFIHISALFRWQLS